MGFRCGIVGIANVGKSTLFNALTHAAVPAANYPFCTIDPNVGIVPVPDPRLDTLTELVPTKKIVPTTMEFVDIAGLVKGASQGEGLGNQFLGHIAEVDAIAHVVRCFEDPNIVHVSGSVDPKRDIDVINTELILRDLGVLTTIIKRLDKGARGVALDKQQAAQLSAAKQLQAALDQGKPARTVIPRLGEDDAKAAAALNLITAKSVLYIANVDETEAHRADHPMVAIVETIAAAEGAQVVTVCAAIESEIAQLTADEQAEFLKELGYAEPGLHRVIRAGYQLLKLLTFFTVGPEENRAWTISQGTKAPQAAGKIHSDFERGFIRAEVIGYDDFLAAKSEAQARSLGRLRLEGKDYVVRDGDIVHFLFNV